MPRFIYARARRRGGEHANAKVQESLEAIRKVIGVIVLPDADAKGAARWAEARQPTRRRGATDRGAAPRARARPLELLQRDRRASPSPVSCSVSASISRAGRAGPFSKPTTRAVPR